jgi:DNA-binding MarR family transcriptional regulator
MPKSRRRGDNYELWRSFAITYKTVQKAVDQNLAPLGIRSQEMRVLFTLNQLGASPMSLIAEEQLMTQASITGIVDDLEARGFVERLRSTEDRRVINVGLTKMGKDILERGLAWHRKFIDKTMSDLTETEAAELSSTLEKLRGAVTSIAPHVKLY